MLTNLWTAVQPMVTEIVSLALLALATYVTTWLRARFKVDLDARHREALHSALRTGAQKVVAELAQAGAPTLARADARVMDVIAYAERSVPDALRHFMPDAQMLEDMAKAKLIEALDPLTAAMRAAGVPAVQP